MELRLVLPSLWCALALLLHLPLLLQLLWNGLKENNNYYRS